MSNPTTDQSPSVSVCIPVYNGASTLTETLRSVLVQTRQPDEIVVVDDGSDDDSMAVVARMMPHARVLRFETNRGAAAAWNAAVGASTAPWIKLLCQDDVLAPTALEHQLEIAQAAPDSTVLVVSRRRIVDAVGNVLFAARGLGRLRGLQTGDAVRREILRTGSNILGEPSAVLVRNRAMAATTGFDPSAAYTIDVEMWVRLTEVGSVWCDPEPVCDFRVSAGQWSVRLANRQATEMNGLLRRLGRDQSRPVGTVLALARNRLDVGLRRTVYWWLRRRSQDR